VTTSPSPTPQFFQRKPSQVQVMQWPVTPTDPEDTASGAIFAQATAAIFEWVNTNDGVIVWRDTGDDFFPAIVTGAGDIPVSAGDWIVRLPGYADPETGKIVGPSRFIAETAADFNEDYQHQARQMRGGLDVMNQIKKIGQLAEVEEATMTPTERREAAQVDTQKLGNVVNRGGGIRPAGKIRDLRNS